MRRKLQLLTRCMSKGTADDPHRLCSSQATKAPMTREELAPRRSVLKPPRKQSQQGQTDDSGLFRSLDHLSPLNLFRLAPSPWANA